MEGREVVIVEAARTPIGRGHPEKGYYKDVHANMKITDAEFKAIAADLTATLNKFNVPAKEQGELMAIVGTTYNDVVQP